MDKIVLDFHCIEKGLQRPRGGLGHDRIPSLLYIDKLGVLQKRKDSRYQREMVKMVTGAFEVHQDVHLVPVSIFWGLKPAKEDSSILKLLFFDELNGGILQRLMLFFLNGRNVRCFFGKPLSIRSQHQSESNPAETAKKLWRVLKVHFRTQREAALGPILYDRRQILKLVLASTSVQKAIQEESRRGGKSLDKIEKLALRYCDEIAAQYSHNIVRMFELILHRVFKKLFTSLEVKHGEEVRELAQLNEIIYVPCHRSHIDYLLLPIALLKLGLMIPHTAGGINLNFWPAGGLLRRAGSFFIRRSFAGNRLYRAVFTEYLHYLISSGYPVSSYIEGGRSRTGQMLKPKTGVLGMISEIEARKLAKPVVFVPVSIGYDKIVEGRTYLNEVRGRAKRSESWKQLLQARKLLRSKFGNAYLSFGEPIPLREHLDEGIEGRDGLRGSAHPRLNKLAYEILAEVNASMIVSPAALVGLLLFGTANNALAKSDLLKLLELLIGLTERLPVKNRVTFYQTDPNEIFLHCRKLGVIQEFEHHYGNVVFIDGKDAYGLNYCRNNILVLYLVPSIISAFFRTHDTFTYDDLCKNVATALDFLGNEFFIKVTPGTETELVKFHIDRMSSLGLLDLCDDSQEIKRPDVLRKEFAYLGIIGNFVKQKVENYAIYMVLLKSHTKDDWVDLDGLADECDLVVKRLDLLHGFGDTQDSERVPFHEFINALKKGDYLSKTDGERSRIKPRLALAMKCFELLVREDLRESLGRKFEQIDKKHS